MLLGRAPQLRAMQQAVMGITGQLRGHPALGRQHSTMYSAAESVDRLLVPCHAQTLHQPPHPGWQQPLLTTAARLHHTRVVQTRSSSSGYWYACHCGAMHTNPSALSTPSPRSLIVAGCMSSSTAGSSSNDSEMHGQQQGAVDDKLSSSSSSSSASQGASPARAPAQARASSSSAPGSIRSIREARAAAAATSSSPVSQAAALAALQQQGITLPQYCCGCGVKLQMEDSTKPGYFIIPSRLLEPRDPEGPGSRSRRGRGGDEGDVDLGVAADDDPRTLEYLTEADGFLGFEDDGGEGREEGGLPDVLCQRCFSLRHAGKVKVEVAESELPEFDLGKKVGRKIALQKDRRAVVLAVVDAGDFDGSLPKAAIMSLYPPGYVPPTSSKRQDSDTDEEGPNVRFRLMVALNKVDLLPKEATHTRLSQWVRQRMQAAGLPRPEKVFCVSANKGTGVKSLVESVRDALGFRGDLWVVGAQNAGKSSLISAMKRVGGTAGQRDPTVAPLPGTTLGLINVPGLPLGAKNRCFDTPGVPHAYQLTSLLEPAEVKQLLPTKPLVPRTFRLPAGNTILMGGLARIDVIDHPGGTIYLTVWASTYINLHMGKTEGAQERAEKHVGGPLTPPASLDRWKELPAWEAKTVVVDGTGWDRSSVDVSIAGLGWVAVGVNGRAELRVWVARSVAVSTRPALIPDYAREFCRPGFTQLLPKSSGAVGAAGSSSAAGAKGVRGGAPGRRDGAGGQQKAAAGSRQGRRS